MSLSAAQRLALLPAKLRKLWLREQSRETLEDIQKGAWWWVGRPEQFRPPGDWLVWLIRSGRGWGKTRTGAEDLLDRLFRHPVDAFGQRTEWLVVAETLNDCRTACIEGNSGLLAVLRRMGMENHRDFEYRKSPKLMIEFNSGQIIYFEGADNDDVGRGYNAAGAWLDELAKWRYTWGAWFEGILPSMRAPLINDRPRVVVTTTPKPIKLLIKWQHETDGTVVITTGSIFDNIANLSREVVEELKKIYEGTRAGLQELYGHLLEDIEGALWNRAMIENNRVKAADLPELKTIVITMDPGATGAGDETGLLAVGRDYNNEDYVLADWTKKIVGHAAARRAWEMFHKYGATWLIIETNMGKKWLMQVVTDAYKEMQKEHLPGCEHAHDCDDDCGRDRCDGCLFEPGPPPVKEVTSLAGKKLRAEPVASRYEQNRWHHVGTFIELEDQLCTWVPEDAKSPDRIDALVQGGLYLMGREGSLVRVSAPPTMLMPVSSPYG
jgi:phage terminase large subunit-like protein